MTESGSPAPGACRKTLLVTMRRTVSEVMGEILSVIA